LRVWGEEKPVRALREISGSTLGGSKGNKRLSFGGSSASGEISTSSSETSSQMAIKSFMFFKYLSSKL
jgi:hypothetical protein